MTALFADGGYGAIYLTPPALVDFSAGEAVLRFDGSTARTSPRDWIDLWISPYDEHLQLPLEAWLPDLQGPPRHAVHLRMDSTVGGTMFRTLVVRDFATQEVSTNPGAVYESVLTPSATTRTTFELRLARTHVKFGLPAYNLWWMDGPIADLGWSSGVVQLGHHSYNPLKDCPAGQSCSPNTWHWDNVSLSAAVPFTLLRATPRAVDSGAAPPVTWSQPAPANAHLQFAGFGSNLQVSFDGGSSWQAAQRQAQGQADTSRFASYWTPLPAGVTQVQFRGQGGWWGPQWKVQDISLWATSAPATGLLCDLNGDGIVDIRDYGIWRQNFGTAGGAAARPSSGALPARGAVEATPVSLPQPMRTPTPGASVTPVRTPTSTPLRRGLESAHPHA
jgi:hypothetical protein